MSQLRGSIVNLALAPAGGVRITLLGRRDERGILEPLQEAQTDEAGRFCFAGLDERPHSVAIRAGAADGDGRPAMPCVVGGLIPPVRELKIQSLPGISIFGQVVDEVGEPVEHGSVILTFGIGSTGKGCTVGQGGAVRFDSVPAIRVRFEYYESMSGAPQALEAEQCVAGSHTREADTIDLGSVHVRLYVRRGRRDSGDHDN